MSSDKNSRSERGAVIRVEDVSKCYHVYDKPSDRLRQSLYPRLGHLFGAGDRRYYSEFWALRNVSLTVGAGETLGIIGRNGAGKSTLLQLICGTLTPTSGSVSVNGRIAALLELGSGFNPEFSGRENVFMNAAILGMPEEEIRARYNEIVEFAEIGEFIDQPVKTYSSGMFMRLAFAVQAHVDASVIVIDEALTVGDVFFRQKCYSRLETLRAAGVSVILVSHSMPDVEQFCERAVLIDNGRVRFIGPAAEAAKHYYLLNQPEAAPAAESAQQSVAATPPASQPTRPPTESFIDIADKPQVGMGSVRCTGVALLDSEGQPKNVFAQGETATFYYEFAIDGDIGVPICGMTISNDRGIIVHGKNNLQYADGAPLTSEGASWVACRQEVKLDLAPGDYTFQVGLAATDAASWKNRGRIPYEAEAKVVRRLCHVSHVAAFSVRMRVVDGVAVLGHHGIADLAGSIEVTAG